MPPAGKSCARSPATTTRCSISPSAPIRAILASASGDRTVKLWDVVSGERLDTLGQSLKDLYCVAFSPNGQYVVAGGVDNRIRMWQVSADAKENTNPLVYSRFAHEGAILKLVYSPDGHTLVSAGEDRTVKAWDAEKLVERYVIERQSDWAAAIAISPDNQTLLVGRLDGTTSSYELATGNPTAPKVSAAVPAPATRLRTERAALGIAGRLALFTLDRALPASLFESAATVLPAVVVAQTQATPAAKPELTGLSLRRLTRGTTARRTLSGKGLSDTTAIKTNSDQLAARIVATTPESLDVEFTAAADLGLGRYEFWAVSPAGESAASGRFRRRAEPGRRAGTQRSTRRRQSAPSARRHLGSARQSGG